MKDFFFFANVKSTRTAIANVKSGICTNNFLAHASSGVKMKWLIQH